MASAQGGHPQLSSKVPETSVYWSGSPSLEPHLTVLSCLRWNPTSTDFLRATARTSLHGLDATTTPESACSYSPQPLQASLSPLYKHSRTTETRVLNIPSLTLCFQSIFSLGVRFCKTTALSKKEFLPAHPHRDVFLTQLYSQCADRRPQL